MDCVECITNMEEVDCVEGCRSWTEWRGVGVGLSGIYYESGGGGLSGRVKELD